MIQIGHFMADEIKDKLESRKQRWDYVLSVKKLDAEQLESWIASREPILKDDSLGYNIAETEDLLKTHEPISKSQ